MNSNRPLVSVTIPAYNHEFYVQTAIESVIKQSYENIELIVIDDGSTDKTADKIRESCEKYKGRIRFVPQKNQGLIRTLNLGLSLSKGEYWCQMASDDFMDERNIEIKVRFLEEHKELYAVCSDASCLRPDQTVSRMIPEKVKPDPLRVDQVRDIFQVKMFFPSLLFRKNVFNRIGNFDESMRYYEDIDMKLRLLLYCKVGYIDEPLLTWRSHGSNTSHQALLRRKERIIAYEKFFTLPELQSHNHLRRKMLGNEHYKYARSLVQSKASDPDHTVSWYLRRSLFHFPFRYKGYYYLLKCSLQNLYTMKK
ncbi:MAG: glycosyltransferase [bacterium]